MDIGIFKDIDELFLSSLAEGKDVRLRVDGTSMSPLLKPGDQVILQRVTPQQLQKGDLVVVHRQHDLVTHRLVCQRGGQWWTKGDNSRYPDPPAAEDWILGKVITIEKPDTTIDLQTERWQFLNRWLARLSYLEASVVRFGGKLGSPHRSNSLASGIPNSSWMARMIAFPFRLILRLVVKVAFR